MTTEETNDNIVMTSEAVALLDRLMSGLSEAVIDIAEGMARCRAPSAGHVTIDVQDAADAADLVLKSLIG